MSIDVLTKMTLRTLLGLPISHSKKTIADPLKILEAIEPPHDNECLRQEIGDDEVHVALLMRRM